MPIKNYTTRVGEHATVSEIQQILSSKGALGVQVDYDNGKPQAIRFVIEVDRIPVPFRLPCNFAGVQKALAKSESAKSRVLARDPERVRRISWRIVKDWIDSQMALIEAEQAAMAEVFLPYVVSDGGKTLYGYWREQILPANRQLKTGEVQ